MVLVYSEDLGLINSKKKDLCRGYDKVSNYFFKDNHEELATNLLQINLFEAFTNNEKEIVFINDFVLKKDEKTKSFLTELKNIDNKKIVIAVSDAKVDTSFKSFFSEIHDLKKLNKFTLKTYVNNWIKKNDIAITAKALEELYKRLPTDMYSIENELDKLLLWSKTKIGLDLVTQIINEDINQNIFNLIDSYFNNDYETLFNQIKIFENKKIDFKEIYYVLCAQLLTLKFYVAHFNQYKSIDKIVKDFAVMKFQVDKWAKLIYNVSTYKIDLLLFNLLKLEIYTNKSERDLSSSLKLFFFKEV